MRGIVFAIRGLGFVLLAALVGLGSPACAGRSVRVAGGIGPEPACPYGYFDVFPYDCAPPGYYGPEWFDGDIFIGAGPWFHGHRSFRGHVDNRFHPDHGYQGPMPRRGDPFDPARRVDGAHFHGDEMRDGRGHIVRGRR
jgi:hypothetical protein